MFIYMVYKCAYNRKHTKSILDIRSTMPLITKQHQNELTIKHVEFHSDGDLKRVASADPIALKVQRSFDF